MRITRVRLQESRPEERERGLMGWVSYVMALSRPSDGLGYYSGAQAPYF